ncbi:MAG TPA: hypothetical protein V6D25_24210 [Leptolyngbyaceae cyanobacterium]
MPRKQNLSDLIQEEAQKFTPSAGEDAIEVTAQPVVEDTAATPEASPTSEDNGDKGSTKADLEATIKELQASLKKSTQQEKTLQQKIDELQAALSEQKSSFKKLTKELEETKKTALQLAEANSQLIEEHKSLALAQEKEQQKLEQQRLEQEKQKQEQLQKQKDIYKPVPYRKSTRLPDNRPTQPTQTTNEIKDDFASNTWLYD